MEIPSIKFRYFEKLKLWHDYLSPKSIFETKKIEYWRHEKTILQWAYSEKHQHLYSYFGDGRIYEIYGIGRERPEINLDAEIISNFLDNFKGRLIYIKGNLFIKGFADLTFDEKGYPKEIRITPKGLLMGEIITESKSNSCFKKDFRKYKWGYWFLVFIIILSVISVFIIFINQAIELITYLNT